jgi:predicted HicB family RNase H-like nuclease
MAAQSDCNYDALCANDTNPLVHARKALTIPVYDHYHAQYDAWINSQSGSLMGTKGFIELLAELPEKLKQWQHKIANIFSEDTIEFGGIFPNGRSDVYRGSYGQRLSKLHSVATEVNKYPALSTVYEEINAYYLLLKDARNNKGVKQDTKDSSSAELDQAYDAMGEMLFSNMLQLTDIYIKTPEVVSNYFDFSLLRIPKKQSEEDNTYILTLPVNSKRVANISFSADDTLLLVNNGTKSIFFYAAATADAATPTTLTEIAAGEELEVTAASLGAPANKFLIFVNTDLTEAGEVEILLI